MKIKNSDRLLVIASSMMQSGKIPTEIMVAPFGKWKAATTVGGEPVEFEITPELALKAVDYHKKFELRFPNRDLPIDYEHATLSGGEAPAAGWFGNLSIKENGIWADVKSWTEKAKQYLLNKEYRYQSPVLCFNDVDGQTGEPIPLWISSMGLTNTPFINSIEPVAAKNENNKRVILYLTDFTQPTQGDTTMLEQILQLLGLAAGATLEEVKKVIEGLKNSSSTVAAKYTSAMKALALKDDASVADVTAFAAHYNAILTELGVKATDSLDTIKGVIVAAKKTDGSVDSPTVIALTKRVNELAGELNGREFADMIKKHTDRGAVFPVEVEGFKADVTTNKIACKDLDTRLALRADNSCVPVGTIVAAKKIGDKIDAETLEIAGNLNVSEEDIKKYGK